MVNKRRGLVHRVGLLVAPVSLCLSLALTRCHGRSQQARLGTDPL